MARWLNSPEWAYLQSLLSDELDGTMQAFVSCNGNDPAKVGRLQATVKVLRWFLDPDDNPGTKMLQELRDKHERRD